MKYEDVYLKKYESVQDLLMGLTHYFVFYNDERASIAGLPNTGRGLPDGSRRRGTGDITLCGA